MGPVHHLHHFPVQPVGKKFLLRPEVLPLFWSPPDIVDTTLLPSVILNKLESDLFADLLLGLAFNINIQMTGYGMELLHILDLDPFCLTSGCSQEDKGHISSVIGMSGGSGSNHAAEISSRNGIHIGPAHTHLGLLGDSAGAHETVLAAHAVSSDGTRFDFCCTMKSR
jgi:hypothetical protein